MARWDFEPGHTAAGFSVRHMMVTWVRGHFKDVHGHLEFDPDHPATLSLEATIQAHGLWTGEPQRDAHLRSADFVDVTNHPTITFQSTGSERTGGRDYQVGGKLTIRGVTKPVTLDLSYLGKWWTPYNEAQVTRVGFTGTTRINRHDFGVSWQAGMDDGGIVVGNDVWITLDVEAILATELKQVLKKSG